MTFIFLFGYIMSFVAQWVIIGNFQHSTFIFLVSLAKKNFNIRVSKDKKAEYPDVFCNMGSRKDRMVSG